jgi:iron complex transport system substrate-binding protein
VRLTAYGPRLTAYGERPRAYGARLAAHARALTVVLALLAAAPGVIGPTVVAQAPGQAPSRRVISLVPAVTEMLFAIGAGETVVGVSSFDTFPPEVLSRPKVGALVDPDFERILTLRPDLVVVYGSQEDLMRRLERASIPYYRYRHAGLADVLATMRDLGARVGLRAGANREAARIEADLSAVRASVAGRRRPRTAVLFGREPGELRGIYASGGVGFLHDLLGLAGGENVFADVKRENLQATTELLLARAPEVIIEIRTAMGWTPDRIAMERAVWNRLPSLPAVRNSRIYFLTDDAISIPGPRVAASAKTLAATLHGDR